MSFITPEITAKDVEDVKKGKTFTKDAVPAGEYEMLVRFAPKVRTSRAGNPYLTLMLTHLNELSKGTLAVYPNINNNEIGQKQFIELLLALGFSTSEIVQPGTGWGAVEGAEADDKGRIPAEIRVGSDSVDLEGRTLNVYLTQKPRKNYATGEVLVGEFGEELTNEVARFIVAD